MSKCLLQNIYTAVKNIKQAHAWSAQLMFYKEANLTF
jgi:hypothetical protein